MLMSNKNIVIFIIGVNELMPYFYFQDLDFFKIYSAVHFLFTDY